MADEILLKAPKVEQQVNITISGENKLYDIADTINCMLNGRNLQDYWKSKQQLFIDLVQAKAIARARVRTSEPFIFKRFFPTLAP